MQRLSRPALPTKSKRQVSVTNVDTDIRFFFYFSSTLRHPNPALAPHGYATAAPARRPDAALGTAYELTLPSLIQSLHAGRSIENRSAVLVYQLVPCIPPIRRIAGVSISGAFASNRNSSRMWA